MRDAPRASPVVARGKIKVDARKALHKLRDHMLVDLHLYATELARAAVALGATRLDVSWDADDVVLSFDAPPLRAKVVASVRDHVLGGEAASDEGDALRTLGIGVTAALGLGPAFVDIYGARGKECWRVRFTPAYIDDEGAASLPAPEALARPGGIPWDAAMRVHVRRKLGLETLARAVLRDAPREIGLLVDATNDGPLAMTVQGRVPHRTTRPVVLSVDLDEPSATRAVLEVLLPERDARASTVFLERGVRLATYPGVRAWALQEADLPVRVLVDAKKLPTNASRSEVRADAELVARVRKRVPRALTVAIAALRGAVFGERDEKKKAATKLGHSVTIVDARPEAHAEALGAIAASVALAVQAGKRVPAAERRLLDLPLMLDAVGAPLSLAAVLSLASRPPVTVFSGRVPERAELAPWLGGIPWLRGGAAERILEGVALTAADSMIAEAHEGHARRSRALAHAPSKPVLARSAAYALVEAFAVKEGPFAGLEGEVAVVRQQGELTRSASVHVFVEERPLEVVPLPRASLPVDMALSWPGRLRARRAYDGVARDAAFEQAVFYALRVAAIAVGERVAAREPELARLAIAAFSTTTARLGDATPSVATLGELASAKVWPTSEPGVLVSLAQLAAYAERTGAICVARGRAGRAVDGRPVLDDAHADAVRALLPAGTKIVPYGGALARSSDAALDWIAEEAATMPAYVRISRPHVEGIAGVGPRRLVVYHRGQRVLEAGRDEGSGPAAIVIEDGAAVPDPGSGGAAYVTPDLDVTREEDELLEMVVGRCESGLVDPLVVAEYLAAARRHLSLRARLSTSKEERTRAVAMHARIVDLPRRAERANRERMKAAFLAKPPRERPPPVHAAATATFHGTGTATASLPPVASGVAWIAPPVEVLFAGRPLTELVVDLPVVATVDVVREDFVKDWASLTEAGAGWVRTAVVGAAVELLKDLAEGGALAHDLGALRLCVELVFDSPVILKRLRPAVRQVGWPTVQGGTLAIGDRSEVPAGSLAYPAYRHGDPASPYDAPAVHLPEGPIGDLRRQILGAVGCTVSDVTEPIARLQRRRARGEAGPPPRLPGEPAHPLLRSRLATLGVTAAEGEIELADATGPTVFRIDARGAATPIAVAMPWAVRVIMRCEDGELVRAASEIAAAAERLVRCLVPEVRGLPPFARDALRTIVCQDVKSWSRSPEIDTLPVFRETSGEYLLRLADFVEAPAVRVTTDPPPYPPHDGGSLILVLSPVEKAALEGIVRFDDVTESLRAELLGLQRRAAEPRERMELDGEMRARCICMMTVEQGGLQGEVGLLMPAHAASRGIHLHTTMRPLTVLEDGDGWPLVAVVNDDTLTPTRSFDGLVERGAPGRIRGALRVAVRARLLQVFDVPPNALGSVRLPFPFVSDQDAVPCLGAFWLEPEWPEAPDVHVEAIGHVDPFRVPRLSATSGARSRILPIRGRVYVCCERVRLDRVLEDVFAHVAERLEALVERAGRARSRIRAESLAAYAWDLRLLGLRDDEDPAAALAEDRPDEILLRVAARRAPHLLQVEAPASGGGAASDTEAPGMPPPSAPQDTSFLQGLVRRVVSLVAPPAEPPDTRLTGALASAIAAMKLTGSPVKAVVEARRGRPVRFDAANKRIVVNTRHDAVRALARDPARVLVLLAAAVSEVNRELEPVTDAEELAVLRDLLRETGTP